MKIEDTQANDVLISRMDIPKSWTESVFAAVVLFIVVFFVLLAVINLLLMKYMPAITLVLSVMWLALVFWQVRLSCKDDGGVRQFATKVVGVFALHQFAEIVADGTGRKMLCFGYQLRRKRYYHIKIQCDGIETVDWEMGQASGMAGRDMNDWSVAVWFDKDSATTLNWASSDKPRFGLHIIGPSRKKQETEELGNMFVEFLRNAGVTAAQHSSAALHGLVGTSGMTSCGLPSVFGKVRLGEREYHARSVKGAIDKDTKVRVVEVRGLTLYVEPVEAESRGKSG